AQKTCTWIIYDLIIPMDPSSREHASKAEPSHARAPGRVKEALCRCPYPLLEAFGTHIVCGPICSRELGRKFKREFSSIFRSTSTKMTCLRRSYLTVTSRSCPRIGSSTMPVI